VIKRRHGGTRLGREPKNGVTDFLLLRLVELAWLQKPTVTEAKARAKAPQNFYSFLPVCFVIQGCQWKQG
jgi:hypothetical protein